MFKGSSTGHRGFKLEYSKASCDQNFTAEQGRIVHEGVKDCWITITASENHTISLYFNQFSLYDSNECTQNSLQASVLVFCIFIYSGSQNLYTFNKYITLSDFEISLSTISTLNYIGEILNDSQNIGKS